MSFLCWLNFFLHIEIGEAEMSNYPCWSRGLVAVYLYFQGRHALLVALHSLVRLFPGLVWGSHVSPKVLEVCKPYVDNLYRDNVVDRALGKYNLQLTLTPTLLHCRLLWESLMVCHYLFLLDTLANFEVKKQLELLDSNLAMGDWRHRTELVKFITCIRVELAEIVFCMAAQQCLTWKDTLRWQNQTCWFNYTFESNAYI
jgi:hypothetical protein